MHIYHSILCRLIISFKKLLCGLYIEIPMYATAIHFVKILSRSLTFLLHACIELMFSCLLWNNLNVDVK